MLSVLRLNQLLDDCNEYSRLSTFKGYNIEYLKLWRNTLRDFQREILPKLKKEEKLQINNVIKKINKIGRIFEPKNTPDGQITILNATKFNQHHHVLHELESLLRILADKKGMLMTNKEVSDSIIGEDE